MKIRKDEFLHSLEVIAPALTAREVTSQSTHAAFHRGKVLAFNGELCIRSACPGGLEGAVVGAKLIEALLKLPEDEIEVSNGGGELLITGKGRRVGVAMEAEVTMQLDYLKTPKEWKPLPEGFNDALKIVKECASQDRSQEPLDCVHLANKFVEASNNYQAIRHKLALGVAESCLVRADHLRHIIPLDMTEFGESDSWIHFRNPAGVSLSCLRMVEPYPIDIGANLKRSGGSPLQLPPRLEEGCQLAEVFSKENKDNNVVEVMLKPGKLRIRGRGVSGWAEKRMSVKYSGPEMTFFVPPSLLVELSKKTSEATVGDGWLLVNGKDWRFIALLAKPETKDAG